MSAEHGHGHDNAARIATDYLEQVWNEGRLELADTFLDADLIQHNSHLPNGSAPLVEFIGGLRQQLPGMHFDIRRVIANGDHAVVHSLFTTGTVGHESAVVDIFRIANGRIVEHWDVREEVPAETASGNPII
jgi:predicted SnoaL-like aldol condensation-catalyzing enzyme